MASIIVNGEHLHPRYTRREDFVELAKTILPRLSHGEPLAKTMAAVLGDALAANLTLDDAAPQTLLLALSDLGVRRIDIDGATVTLGDAEPNDVSRGDARAFAVASIENGRALVAALANFVRRTLTVNGQTLPAMPQPTEDLKRFLGMVQANRLVNEELMFTACRALAGFTKAGKGMEDPDYRCAVQLACELGVSDVVIDLDAGKLAIRDFDESNAAAAALLQTGNVEIVRKAREKIQALKRKLAETKAAAAAGQPPAAGPAPERIVIPARIGTRRRRA